VARPAQPEPAVHRELSAAAADAPARVNPPEIMVMSRTLRANGMDSSSSRDGYAFSRKGWHQWKSNA
jgi:hypothetical protein